MARTEAVTTKTGDFMNDGELWILDSLVEGGYPLFWLISENLEMVFNRDGHNLTYPNLVKTLFKLFSQGDLQAIKGNNFDLDKIFLPTIDDIEKGLHHQSDFEFVFRLTHLGGKKWETYTQPDWKRYIDAGYYTEPNIAKIITSDKQNLEKYVAIQHLFWKNTIIENSFQRQILTPWHATYWKILPIGYEVTFSYAVVEELDTPKEDIPKQAQEWYDYMINWKHP